MQPGVLWKRAMDGNGVRKWMMMSSQPDWFADLHGIYIMYHGTIPRV